MVRMRSCTPPQNLLRIWHLIFGILEDVLFLLLKPEPITKQAGEEQHMAPGRLLALL